MKKVTDFRDGPALMEVVDRLVLEHNLACEQLTEKQLVEALAQALACGDFQRYVTTNGDQTVVYLPYCEEERLRARIEELEKKLSNVGLDEECEEE